MLKVILPFFLILCLLSGCGNIRELNQIAIVLGAAIDLTKDGEIELTVQFLNPHSSSSSGGGAGGSGGEFTVVRTIKGLTVADATSKLQEIIPRKIFWGHCSVFVFGEKLAKKGILDATDYIIRSPQTREQALLFISNGEAKDIFNVTPPLEKQSGRVLQLLSQQHILMSVTVKDFIEMKLGSSDDTFLPYVDVLPTNPMNQTQKTIPYINGTAILKKGKMIGTLNDSLTRGVMWLRNEVKQGEVVVKRPLGKPGTITLAPFQASVHLTPLIKDGHWKMIVKGTAKGEIVENVTSLDVMNLTTLQGIEKEMEKDISKRIIKAYSTLQKDMDADIVGFAEEFHRKYPDQWKKERNHWDKIYRNMPLDIEIDAHIIGPGLMTIPTD